MPSAILAEIVGYNRVHLLPDFTSEIADFLTPQVDAEGCRYMGTQMRDLMED